MRGDAWWPYGTPRKEARWRLFCLPFAGGGASAYRKWRLSMGSEIDVCPIQLPGREGRIRETPYRSVEPLVDELVPLLRPGLIPPYAFFGYSMGALISFELAHRLADLRLPGPSLLFAAAARPPHLMRTRDPLHALPDAAFTEALRALNGTPEAVLAHRELMELLMPTLRADFELCETYAYRERRPLSCPIVVFGGDGDPNVSSEEIREWGRLTEAGFTAHGFEGDHFFMESSSEEILRRVRESLGTPAGES